MTPPSLVVPVNNLTPSPRELVTTTYKTPQIHETDDLTTLMDQYTYNYRRMFIEHPRIRLDGVYIAICHYV